MNQLRTFWVVEENPVAEYKKLYWEASVSAFKSR